MKKILMTLAAVLCCAMTTTVFTACGDDDDDPISQTPKEQNEPTKVPVSVGVQFFVKNSADMLKYLDIVVKYSDGEKEYSSPVLTEELLEANTYNYKTQVLLTKLPGQFKIWREVKVKEALQDSAKNLETFDYTNYIDYGYALYDADYKMIGSVTTGDFGFIHGPAQNPEMVRNFFSKLDQNFGKVFELNFDKDGKMVK